MDFFIRKNQLLLAIISAIVVGFAVYILVNVEGIQNLPPPNESSTSPANSVVPVSITPAYTITIERNVTIDPSPSATITFIPSVTTTPEPDASFTPPPFPTPFKGALGENLPPRFRVGSWISDYIQCDKDRTHYSVKIYGVEIAYGYPPYEFTFWQLENISTRIQVFPIQALTTSTPSPNNNSLELVIFDEPVVINKGAYAHVVIVFDSVNGRSTWIDDLYYPRLGADCK